MALNPTEATCLSDDWIAETNFFHLLDAEDARTAAAVKAADCPDCGGCLDQANYPRKPRGGEVGAAGEIFDRRRSFCCRREGCRHRRTPASLVFLGRRVYLAVTIVLTAGRSAVTVAPPLAASPARRTLRRWLAWFATELPVTTWFTTVRARLSPPMEPNEHLPGALVKRLFGAPRRAGGDHRHAAAARAALDGDGGGADHGVGEFREGRRRPRRGCRW